MKRVVTFGELMLRLAPNGSYRVFQNAQMQATCGGGEANVALRDKANRRHHRAAEDKLVARKHHGVLVF